MAPGTRNASKRAADLGAHEDIVPAVAEREVVRRQQLSNEADAEVTSAINDVNTRALNSARLKLKKAVEKYPR